MEGIENSEWESLKFGGSEREEKEFLLNLLFVFFAYVIFLKKNTKFSLPFTTNHTYANP